MSGWKIHCDILKLLSYVKYSGTRIAPMLNDQKDLIIFIGIASATARSLTLTISERNRTRIGRIYTDF